MAAKKKLSGVSRKQADELVKGMKDHYKRKGITVPRELGGLTLRQIQLLQKKSEKQEQRIQELEAERDQLHKNLETAQKMQQIIQNKKVELMHEVLELREKLKSQ
jgi:alkyl sulfatase BDS1-like metallo-beta-lactamase superfamily hydrolase